MNSSVATTRSTAGPGFAFEDLVAADLLSRLLLDMPIPGINVPGLQLLSQVRALGWAIDDLQCLGVDAEGRQRKLALSCKSQLQVNSNGLPADYISAAWEMWRKEACFCRETDCMALVTRGRHPTFDAAWHDIKTWCDDGDEKLALARIQASAKHQRVFDTVRSPGAQDGTLPSIMETCALIRRLEVYPVDFQLTPSDMLAAARHRCRMALMSESQIEADDLWRALVQRAEDARLGNGTIALADLLGELGGQFALKAHPSSAAAWRRLLVLSHDHLVSVETSLPNGHVIDRAEGTAIVPQLTSNFGCVVTGDSGVGKSALIRQVLDRDFPDATQLWFGPDVLAAALNEADRDGLGLNHPLLTILERSPGNDCIMVIDSAERLDATTTARLVLLLEALRSRYSYDDPKWRVVIAIQIVGFLDQPRGVKLLDSMPRILIPSLSDHEVKQALLSVPQLRWVATDADVLPMLANLRTLGWVIAGASSFTKSDTDALASVTAIADRLWARWTGGSVQLGRFMIRLAERDAAFERSFAISQLDAGDDAAFDALPGDAPLITNARHRIEFKHDLASDWARYQRLKEMADDITAWSALAPQPLWISALRLFGQHLLTEPDQARHGWDHAFANVTASGNVAAADLLLDALCLDSKLDEHLTARVELFFADNGALLLRLFHRFVHLATTPRIPDSATIEPGLRIYLDAEMRMPIIGRWPPMLRFLAGHLRRVAQLGAPIVSKLCSLWLGGTSIKFGAPTSQSREIMARLALETARTEQVVRIAHFSFGGRGDVGKSIFAAALTGAADLPKEVSAFALEMARRRPISESVRARVEELRAAEHARREAAAKTQPPRQRPRAMPAPFMSSREELPPWPLGATGRLTGAFRDAALHGQALTQLMQVDPATASEVLLACIIDDQPSRDFNSTRIDEELGLAGDDQSHPTMFWKSPFFSYFLLQPEAALAALKQLLDFVMERWAADAPRGRQLPALKVRLGGRKSRTFRGSYRQFGWSQENSLSNGQLFSALDALERWLVLKIEAGEDIASWCQRLLDMGTSTALLGVLVNLGKRQPTLFQGILAPLLEVEELYLWDDHRAETSHFGFDVMTWVRFGDAAFKLARDWVLAPHRRTRMRSVAIDLVAVDPKIAARIKMASAGWTVSENVKEQLEQQMLRAALDPANHRNVVDEATGESSIAIAYPPNLQRAVMDYQNAAAIKLQPLTLPHQCEKILAGEDDLSPENADYLASLIPAIGAPLPEGDDIRTMLAAAAATLIIKGGPWLKHHPDVIVKVHHVILTAIAGVGESHAELSRDGFVADTSLRFAALGAFHSALNASDPRVWNRALLTVITSRDMAALGAMMRDAAHKRERLAADWYRLNLLLILSAGLDRLAPRCDEAESLGPLWGRWLARFRSLRLFGHPADFAMVDPVGVGRRVERLLERRRARLSPHRPARLTGRARRFAGISSHILNTAFAWLLDHENAAAIAQLPENRILIARLWAFEGWRMECDGDLDDEDEAYGDDEYDLPSQLGYAILRILPNVILASSTDEARQLWRAVLNLGPRGHYAVDQFAACWFLLLFSNPDPDRFVGEWRAMLDFALASNWSTSRRWYRGRSMLVNLLGLNAPREISSATAVRERLGELLPNYRTWATTHMVGDEDAIEAFCHFLTTEAGRFLHLEGVIWLKDALVDTRQFYRDNCGNKIAEALDSILSHHAGELAAKPESRDAMIAIAALLVRNEVTTAMGLQARIAGLR